MNGDHIKRHYHADLHAHEFKAQRDCDGLYEHGGIWWLTRVPLDTIADTPTADLDFERLVFMSNVNWFEGTEATFGKRRERQWHDHAGCKADHDCHIEVSGWGYEPDPWGPEGCDCFLTKARDVMTYGYRTDEGWVSGETKVCDDPACREDADDVYYRDHTAEAAGY